jgi:hypothetical protein
MKAYKIRVNDQDYPVITVKGYAVKLDGWESYKIFVHRTPIDYDKKNLEPLYGSDWTVSEASTGLRIASGETRNDAEVSAFVVLRREGKERFDKEIAAHLLPAEPTIAKAEGKK